MVDKIIRLEDNTKYIILDEKELDNTKYYYGLELDEKEEKTDNYLFFEEIKDGSDVYLLPVEDEQIKGLLLSAFTVNYLNSTIEEVN